MYREAGRIAGKTIALWVIGVALVIALGFVAVYGFGWFQRSTADFRGAPTYRYEDRPNDGSNTKYQVPAPAMDGVYYSGNQCDGYYGRDAVSGAYWEYTIGNGITHLVSSEPLPRQDVEPLGVATIESVDADN